MTFLVKSKETDELLDVVETSDKKSYEKKHLGVYLESLSEGILNPFEEDDE